MKKIEILCVGKMKENYYTEAIAEYQKRLSRFCNFGVTELPEKSEDVQKESGLILQKLDDGYNILLDLTGESVTSEEFAKTIDTAFTRGALKVRLIIGGSRGVSNEVRATADKVFSFGAVTYPHQLMRVIAAEQLYRAMCILNGTPYHK